MEGSHGELVGDGKEGGGGRRQGRGWGAARGSMGAVGEGCYGRARGCFAVHEPLGLLSVTCCCTCEGRRKEEGEREEKKRKGRKRKKKYGKFFNLKIFVEKNKRQFMKVKIIFVQESYMSNYE
jgi:hypothetical protein